MKKIVFVSVLLFMSGQLFSGNEKYRLILTNDPTSTITIGWDQTTGTGPIVYYDTIDHGTNYALYAFTNGVDRSVNYRGMNNKFARLTGLLANKAYYFVIHDNEGTSDRFWFKTSPNDLSRLSIIAGGDSRTNRPPRQRANLLVSKLKPNAILFGGDMTQDDTDIQWKNWMDDWQYTIAADGRMFPIVPTMGNHESNEVVYNLFDTPTDTYYYATTFGDNLFRVYSLNTEVSVSGDQLAWLQNDLDENANVIWKAAQYHRPMRPHYDGKNENDAAYDAWAQLFFDKDVRLIIECDAHTVKQTWPIEPSLLPGNDEGFIQNETFGCVYIGEGGWGAPLRNNNDNKTWTRDSGKFYQFKLLFVDESKIEVRTIKTNNANSVGEVSNDDPFTLPDNLDIWSPTNGDVVEIFPAPPMNKPEIAFSGNPPLVYLNGEDISLDIEILDTGNGIDNVSFYVDDILEMELNSPPYTFTHSYPDGQYLIEAVATDITGLHDNKTLNINIGNFSESGDVLVRNGQDDVEETEAGLVYYSSSDLEMMYDSWDFVPNVPNGFQKIGLRFQNVYIPKGAVIDNAYIQFRSDEANSQFAEFLTFAENSGDAVPFDNGDLNVSSRNTFSESIYWDPPAWTSASQTGPAQRTPDLGELLQQIIDRDDWTAGNSIVFKIEGTGVSLTDPNAKRVADSYEGKPEIPPTLNYTFSFDASLTSLTEEQSNKAIYVYPNPFNNTLHITFPGKENFNATIQITDVLGNLAFSKTMIITDYKSTVYPTLQNKGVYIVRILSGSGEEMFRGKIIRY